MNFLDIVANRAKSTLTITDDSAKIVNAFRMCKRIKAHELKGKFILNPIDRTAGLNIRKAKFDEARAVYQVFKPFTSIVKSSLAVPFFDDARKSLVSTDGKSMLFCDIPEGLTIEKAKGGGFCTDATNYANWTIVLNGCNRENTSDALADFDKIGEVEKGSDLHNLLALSSACSRAYRHTDGQGLWHNLYVWVGDNQYDPVMLSDLVSSLYRLGCDKVGFYYPKLGYSYKPLHLVGFGDGLNARGLLMPMRFPSTECGGIAFPIEATAAKAA